jgi:hypothetical protein
VVDDLAEKLRAFQRLRALSLFITHRPLRVATNSASLLEADDLRLPVFWAGMMFSLRNQFVGFRDMHA